MLKIVIALSVILICTIRIVSYGIYTIKDKNITGGIGLFVMASITALSSVYFFLQ